VFLYIQIVLGELLSQILLKLFEHQSVAFFVLTVRFVVFLQTLVCQVHISVAILEVIFN